MDNRKNTFEQYNSISKIRKRVFTAKIQYTLLRERTYL